MLHHVYCDESRQTADRFMILGGMILDLPGVMKFNESIAKFREESRMFSELKWGKVSRGKLPDYMRLVEYFFALNNTDAVHFHSLIIDNSQVDHRRFNQGDRELGFYKFYYQLLLHCFGAYCRKDKDDKFLVFLDHRNSSYSLEHLRLVLNRGINKKYAISTTPFRKIEARDSKACEIIQVVDIILGAIGFQKNGYHLLAGASQPRIELANFIAKQAGRSNLGDNSRFSESRFRIWNFQLQKK